MLHRQVDHVEALVLRAVASLLPSHPVAGIGLPERGRKHAARVVNRRRGGKEKTSIQALQDQPLVGVNIVSYTAVNNLTPRADGTLYMLEGRRPV